MRQIGSIQDERLAGTLSDYLYAKGIKNKIEYEEDGTWEIWVFDEEQLETSRKLMDEFLLDPGKKEFKDHLKQAQEMKHVEEKEEKTYQKRVEASKIRWRNLTSGRIGPVTKVLIALSAIVFLVSGFGGNAGSIQYLFITEYRISGNMIQWLGGLPEITSGQVWRLVTPIIIHFGFMHILFNMLWLKDLGSQIENRFSSRYLAFFILFCASLSNVSQYIISGPSFGGMSGVVYGLFGFIWIRSRYDPISGFYLDRIVVIMLIGWFFLCLSGLIGGIANTAHGVGLVFGMIWGYITAYNANLARKP